MRVYADGGALIKRSVDETESEALQSALGRLVADDAAIVSSSLARVEVGRGLRALLDSGYRDDDGRLTPACRHNGLSTAAPGRPSRRPPPSSAPAPRSTRAEPPTDARHSGE